MKKTLLGLLCISFIFTSCVDEKKDAEVQKNEVSKTQVCHYTLDKKSSKLSWTAFKTTDKLAVNGVFDKFDIQSNNSSSDVNELLKSTKFTIHSSSINSGNEARDIKLVSFFFGNTINNGVIKGYVKDVTEKTLNFYLTFNGISLDVPFKYTVIDKQLVTEGIIDLNAFKAEKAIDRLNQACNEKHKAADGISKTWPEVEISFSSTILTTCE